MSWELSTDISDKMKIAIYHRHVRVPEHILDPRGPGYWEVDLQRRMLQETLVHCKAAKEYLLGNMAVSVQSLPSLSSGGHSHAPKERWSYNHAQAARDQHLREQHHISRHQTRIAGGPTTAAAAASAAADNEQRQAMMRRAALMVGSGGGLMQQMPPSMQQIPHSMQQLAALSGYGFMNPQWNQSEMFASQAAMMGRYFGDGSGIPVNQRLVSTTGNPAMNPGSMISPGSMMNPLMAANLGGMFPQPFPFMGGQPMMPTNGRPFMANSNSSQPSMPMGGPFQQQQQQAECSMPTDQNQKSNMGRSQMMSQQMAQSTLPNGTTSLIPDGDDQLCEGGEEEARRSDDNSREIMDRVKYRASVHIHRPTPSKHLSANLSSFKRHVIQREAWDRHQLMTTSELMNILPSRLRSRVVLKGRRRRPVSSQSSSSQFIEVSDHVEESSDHEIVNGTIWCEGGEEQSDLNQSGHEESLGHRELGHDELRSELRSALSVEGQVMNEQSGTSELSRDEGRTPVGDAVAPAIATSNVMTTDVVVNTVVESKTEDVKAEEKPVVLDRTRPASFAAKSKVERESNTTVV